MSAQEQPERLWEAIASRDLRTLVNLLNDKEEIKHVGRGCFGIDSVAIEVLSELSRGKEPREEEK